MVKIIKKAIKPPSLRAQKAVSLLLASPSKAEALRRAGYSSKTARVPGDVFNQPSVRPLIKGVIMQLEDERREVLERMKVVRIKASYGVLVSALGVLNRDIELLDNKPIPREDYELPEEEKRHLDKLLEMNKKK